MPTSAIRSWRPKVLLPSRAIAVTNLSSERDPVGSRLYVPEMLSATKWRRLVGALGLSPREADILRCAFYDARTTAMARELGLSVGTVHTYRDRMFRKLGVAGVTQL